MEGGPTAAEGQCGSSLTKCSRLLLTLVDFVVVIVQLCVSDGVEDLMESLTVESEKSLTSQEPDSHHGVGSSAEHLQGELTPDLSQRTCFRGDQVPAATPRVLFPSDPDSGARQDSTAVPQTLQQEFSLVNLQIRNVNVEVRCLACQTCGDSEHTSQI